MTRTGDEVQHDFGIRCRLTDGAGGDDLSAKRQAIGEIAVMGNRNAAFFQLGKQWLHVAHRHFACRGVAGMANRDGAGQAGKGCRIGIMIADEAHMAFLMEALAIEGDDACCLLAAMLKRMQAECSQGGGIGVAENAEHAALFVQRVAVDLFIESGMRKRLNHPACPCSLPRKTKDLSGELVSRSASLCRA